MAHGSVGCTMELTPPAIDPGTVRLVAECLNHYATPDCSTLISVGSCWLFYMSAIYVFIVSIRVWVRSGEEILRGLLACFYVVSLSWYAG